MAIIFRYGRSGVEGPGILVAGGFEQDCAAFRKTLLQETLEEAGLKQQEGEFFQRDSGQPFVRSGTETYAVSVSHTGNFIVLALSLNGMVGIDAERADREVADRLRKRILSHQAGPAEQEIPLLKLWTIKEAFLKMTGTGLRFPMNKVDVRRPEQSDGHTFSCKAHMQGEPVESEAVTFLYREYRISFCHCLKKV